MRKVLIIEDEPELLEGLQEILFFEGFKVLTANNGLQGIELALDSVPDIILCDIMMPGIDGFEVVKRLRNHSKTITVPIVLITALSERANIRKGMELGANDYLIKPFTRLDLLNLINAQFEILLKEQKKEKEHNSGNIDTSLEFNLSHDFRTPLNVILGFSSLMKHPDDYPNEMISQMGESIYSEGIRLFFEIKKHLVLVDIEINKKSCDVNQIKNIDQFIEDTIKPIALKYKRPNDLKLSLTNCDAYIKKEWFEIVIQELSEIAFKFSQQGRKIIIESQIINDRLLFTFLDNGIGYSESTIDEINSFESFSGGITSRQDIFGILLCKKIILEHNGEMTVKNNFSDGSTTTFSIPYTDRN